TGNRLAISNGAGSSRRRFALRRSCSGGSASLSSPRMRGPMNTCRCSWSLRATSMGHGVWVPAFAGTTRRLAKGLALPNDIEQLYRRPGFMIRRAHQISVSIFLDETGELGITNRQYGILLVLKQQPGIDQISVAKLLGLDRSTTAMVLAKVEESGLVARGLGRRDRRRRSLLLTRVGEKMLERLAEPARRAQTRLLAAFSPSERAQFLGLLDKLLRKFNDSTRVPLEAGRASMRVAASGRKKHPPSIPPEAGKPLRPGISKPRPRS